MGKIQESGSRQPAGPEPWLRDTLKSVPAVARGVLHALELAREDIGKWSGDLSQAELNARPGGIAPVAFHLRHIARSLDRLLTYAEGGALNNSQLAEMQTELDVDAMAEEIFAELETAFENGAERLRSLGAAEMEQARYVGAKRLPTTLGGLLVHIADHTQRHVGQLITTAKIVISQRD